jgi:transcriptional regulator PpsR
VKQFRAPQHSLGNLDAEAAAALIVAAADVALILDPAGAVLDVAFDGEEISLDGFEHWLGRPWAATVTSESRAKIEALLKDARAGKPRWRQVNHPAAGADDIPVLYCAIQVGRSGRIVAVGRDLRPIAGLQRRLVDAQQSMERDYARLRHVETRYRLLFQMSAEAVLIVDAATGRVVEANPAAGRLFVDHAKTLLGRSFPEGFDAAGTAAMHALLAGVRASGRSGEVRARRADGKAELVASASLFRQEDATLFLIRLVPREDQAAHAAGRSLEARLLEVVEQAPDGMVITDPAGRILRANAAFLELAQLVTAEQAQGESLERWLARAAVDLNVLLTNLRQHGSVRLFATTFRGEYGATAEVEISAVAVPGGEEPCLGFVIRNVGRRLPAQPRAARELPRSVEQLTELVGRVPLKELVRETTDVIERLCIEAALELSGDNRASAADMLGLSRQSLYVKLRRYGLGDLASATDE